MVEVTVVEVTEMEKSIDRKRNKFIQENDWIQNVEDFIKKKEFRKASLLCSFFST